MKMERMFIFNSCKRKIGRLKKLFILCDLHCSLHKSDHVTAIIQSVFLLENKYLTMPEAIRLLRDK